MLRIFYILFNISCKWLKKFYNQIDVDGN